MSFEAESNSRVDRDHSGIPVAFPISGAKQNTIVHKQTKLSDTQTGILGSIAGPCDFLPTRSDEFQKVYYDENQLYFVEMMIMSTLY